MLRYIIFAVAAFLLYKLFVGEKKQKEKVRQQDEETRVASGEMVKDPVCNTYVCKEGDIRVREGDKVTYFCSYECRDKYLQELEGGQSAVEENAGRDEA